MRSKPQLVVDEVLMQYDETEKPLLAFDHSPDNAQHSNSKVFGVRKFTNTNGNEFQAVNRPRTIFYHLWF